MEALKILEQKEKLNWKFDEEADVLYISISKPQKTLGVDVGDGVIVRYQDNNSKMKENDLQILWNKTKNAVAVREKEIVSYYISFLRKVAKHYLKKRARVFFCENKVVHYGEGGFGWMIIESKENKDEVFDDYVPGIEITSKANEKIARRGYREITFKNLNDIKYQI